MVVAASGPSLTPDVAQACAGERVIAVNDAYRLFPGALALYCCDEAWWDVHKGCPDFRGEKWSSHGDRMNNYKIACADQHGLNLVRGKHEEGFSLDPGFIHYGSNSGFQAINLALLFGFTTVLLVGFDMRVQNGKRHFFGDHPEGLRNQTDYVRWVPQFAKAAKMLPPHIEIINCTPQSALTCFEMMDLADALSRTPRRRSA